MVMPQALCSLEEYQMHFGGRMSETQARFIAYCVISGWVEVQQFSATEPLVHVSHAIYVSSSITCLVHSKLVLSQM